MGMTAEALLVAVLASCSGNKARTGDDAVRAVPRVDAAVAVSSDAAPGPAGELAVRVEWKAVAIARSSPGRTPCNTPRAPSVAPTTTFGIPEAFVRVEGATAVPAEAHVVLADCALRPRVAVGKSLVIESAVDRPTRVTLTKQGSFTDTGALHPGEPRVIQLPIAGHAVSVPLDADGVYLLATDGKDPETAWIVAAPVAITDVAGLATVTGLAPGSHAVTVWLPPRGARPARDAQAPATVVANELVEVTVTLK